MTDNFQPAPRPHDAFEQRAKTLSRAFNARRHEARRDDSGFEQSEIILRKVENFGEFRDVRRRAEINAGQSQHRFLDHAQVGFNRRTWRGVAAMHAEINRDIQHARAFGEIHAEEKDVAPRTVRQVHAHGRAFAENRIRAVRRTLEQLGANAQRLIARVPHAEHPLVAAHGAHAAAHLIGEGLEREPVIRRRQRAGDGVARAVALLQREEFINRLLEAALQQMLVALEGNQPAPVQLRDARNVEAVNGVEKEQRAHALVEIAALAPKRIQRRALRKQSVERQFTTHSVE